ncbi:hypothetical protein BH10ACI4_BH10ACI4_02560 [soil metagenome]
MIAQCIVVVSFVLMFFTPCYIAENVDLNTYTDGPGSSRLVRPVPSQAMNRTDRVRRIRKNSGTNRQDQ